MSATQKLRWMRLVNEMRFIHEEDALIKEVISAGEKDFHEYYMQFAERHGLDIAALNEQHQERIAAAYGRPPENAPPLPPEVTGSLTVYESPSAETPNRSSEYEMTKDELEVHESFSKLFKSIAMKIHPDKISQDTPSEQRAEYILMFKEATNALEHRRYFLLLDMASALKIPQPKNYRQQVRWMKKEIDRISKDLRNKKQMYTYLFAECETDEERDVIIARFMRQLFGPISLNNA